MFIRKSKIFTLRLKTLFGIISIFYPSGELISPHLLRCSPLAVVHYSFAGHCLAVTATSTREYSRAKYY